jgi:hypothetical protein
MNLPRLAVALLASLPLFAQTPTQQQSAEVPPHDITKVDSAPLGGAIAVPLPESQRKRLKKYDIPELVGSRQALGSQLIKGELPRPVIDYIARNGKVEERLSLFEGGLVVVNVTGAGATMRKKLILPDDAVKNYLQAISPKALAAISVSDLVKPRDGRQVLLRVYSSRSEYVERSFDPIAVLPKGMNDQVLPLQDLLRAISEDRGITNTVAGYIPAVGDQLVADDRKVYRVMRVIDNVVELHCINQPTIIYVEIKNLYNYFIGTTGAAKQ